MATLKTQENDASVPEFLDAIEDARRQAETLTPAPATLQNGLFAALFFAAAIGMAGMPPLSGFLGKLLILDALRAPGIIGWAWPALLIGSLLTIVGFARAGSALFWKSTAVAAPDPAPEAIAVPPMASALQLAPAMAGIAMLGALSAFAGPVAGYLEGTATQLYDRQGYVSSVLNPGGGE